MVESRSRVWTVLALVVVWLFGVTGVHGNLAEGSATITNSGPSRVVEFTVTDGYSVDVDTTSTPAEESVLYLTSCKNSLVFSDNTKYTSSDGVNHDVTLGKDGCMQVWMQSVSASSISVNYVVVEYEVVDISTLVLLLVFFSLCACLPIVVILALAVVAAVCAIVVALLALVVVIIISPFVITFVILFWPCILVSSLSGGGLYGFFHFKKTKPITAIYLLLLPCYCLSLPMVPLMLVGLAIGLMVVKCGPSLKRKMLATKVSPNMDEGEVHYNRDDVEVQEFVLQEDDSMPLPIAIGDSDDDMPPHQAAPPPVVVDEVEIPFHVVDVEVDMSLFSPQSAPRLPRVIQMEKVPAGGVEAFPVQPNGGAPAGGIEAFPVNGD